jgi:cardiolipin synthase
VLHIGIYNPYVVCRTVATVSSICKKSQITTSYSGCQKLKGRIRIVLPGIPDKKIVNSLTKSYYSMLIEDGVKIYEYKPGFIHSKVFVSDDNVATVGTFNLDYRSLYLHFECGVYMENVNEIKNIKKDLTDAISKSHLVTMEETKQSFIKELWQGILRLIAPLM